MPACVVGATLIGESVRSVRLDETGTATADEVEAYLAAERFQPTI